MVSWSPTGVLLQLFRTCLCRLLEDLHQVHHNRYLLQPIALQLVFHTACGKPPVLLAAPTQPVLRTLSAVICSRAPSAIRLDRHRKVEAAAAAAKRWASGEGTNFEYLMTLNTLAGRSHVDLSQYPVFPWVVSDWTSRTLDLENPSVFRDLSRPIGALEPKRLRAFQERFRSLEDDGEDFPFFYGTHYSSASIVLWYLIRVEPFAAFARQLQARSCPRHYACNACTFCHRNRFICWPVSKVCDRPLSPVPSSTHHFLASIALGHAYHVCPLASFERLLSQETL
jgi:hypothetical protein